MYLTDPEAKGPRSGCWPGRLWLAETALLLCSHVVGRRRESGGESKIKKGEEEEKQKEEKEKGEGEEEEREEEREERTHSFPVSSHEGH